MSLELRLKSGDKIQTPSMITIIPKFHCKCGLHVGRNGKVVLGAYFQMVFSTDLAHFLVYNSSHTFCLDLILLCNLLQCCGTRSVFTNVNKSRFFTIFWCSKGLRTLFPYTGVKVPNLDMSCSNDPTYFVLKSKASCLPNL